jgi:glycosyltransferase involved in cell wall biosynthesis
VRVCVVYDCLYPWTVGGAEAWYRSLAEALAADGHEVTYLTRRQWEDGSEPDLPGITVIAVSPGGELYGPDGNRTIGPPIRFGLGVFRHLIGRRSDYDMVHTCAFPYFSLPAIRLALAGARVGVIVDWHEVWSSEYWRGYLGPVAGQVGHAIQRVCALLTPRAFVFSQLHADRLRREGMRGPIVILRGQLPAPPARPEGPDAAREPVVVYAGRHIPEKRAHVLPAAVAVARRTIPGLRARIYGDGPERPHVAAEVERWGVGDAVELPGFVDRDVVDRAIGDALCLVLPSSREGYGRVVVEAAAQGTPSIVVAGPDNAASEFIEEDQNGFVAPSTEPDDLAAAIVRAHQEGAALRERTSAWFARHAEELDLATSLRRVREAYGL